MDAAPLFSGYFVDTTGYEPVHTKHPGEVLGHRAIKTLNLPFQFRSQGFDGLSLSWFKLKDSLATRARLCC